MVSPLTASAIVAAAPVLEQAILATLAYSDVFDYPLSAEEIHRYLPLRATRDGVDAALSAPIGRVGSEGGYYFLAGREALVAARLQRATSSRRAFRAAMRIGRLLGGLPFIRMVALTGSLALLNSGESADLDYMLVTAPARVWTARGFALLLGRLTRRLGYRLCPNLIVSERRLAWDGRDLYSAREICQMIPIAGADIYERLRCANPWTAAFLPNASGAPGSAGALANDSTRWRALREWPLHGGAGDRLEAWEMMRKVRRLTQQPGSSEETRFDGEICQGNFDRHGARTRAALRERLVRLGIDPSLAFSPQPWSP